MPGLSDKYWSVYAKTDKCLQICITNSVLGNIGYPLYHLPLKMESSLIYRPDFHGNGKNRLQPYWVLIA